MLERQQFAPAHGSALRRQVAYKPQPAGCQSTDAGPTESPSKPLPDQGATRIRFPEFADEPLIWLGRAVELGAPLTPSLHPSLFHTVPTDNSRNYPPDRTGIGRLGTL